MNPLHGIRQQFHAMPRPFLVLKHSPSNEHRLFRVGEPGIGAKEGLNGPFDGKAE